MADDANRSKAAPALGGNPSFAESIDAGGAAGSRRLVQSTTATTGTGEAAILHAVAIKQSNPRLAGLMLRCEQQGIEAVVVVVEPFPPHARPQITLPAPGQESQFIGTIIPTDAGIRLPGDATSLVKGPWRMPRELEIKGADAAPRLTASSPLRDFPRHSHRSTPNVSKNKTLRDHAFDIV
jgi:hypothetical protein